MSTNQIQHIFINKPHIFIDEIYINITYKPYTNHLLYKHVYMSHMCSLNMDHTYVNKMGHMSNIFIYKLYI